MDYGHSVTSPPELLCATKHNAQLQASAVLTVKGHIAAATYRIGLRLLIACRTFPILCNGMGYVPQNCQFPWGIWAPNQEQTRVGPKNNNTVLRAHILRMRCAAKFSFRSVAQPHRSVHFQIIQSFGSPQFQDSDPPD